MPFCVICVPFIYTLTLSVFVAWVVSTAHTTWNHAAGSRNLLIVFQFVLTDPLVLLKIRRWVPSESAERVISKTSLEEVPAEKIRSWLLVLTSFFTHAAKVKVLRLLALLTDLSRYGSSFPFPLKRSDLVGPTAAASAALAGRRGFAVPGMMRRAEWQLQ